MKIWKRTILRDCIVLFLATFFLLAGARFLDKRWPTGDEPHYILLAQSIYNDRDIDIKNNFLDKKYIGVIYGGELTPHINRKFFTLDSPKQYSLHNIGLPILLLPAFVLTKLIGFWIINSLIIVMSAISATLVVASYIYVRQITNSRKASLVATSCVAISLSFVALGPSIFPDLPAVLLILLSLIAIHEAKKRPSSTIILYALASFCAAYSVLIHVKYLLIALTLVCFMLAECIKRTKRPFEILAILFPVSFVLTMFGVMIHNLFGTWNIFAVFGNGQIFRVNPFIALVAVLFDTSKGILFHNPIFYLVLFGLPIWWKTNPQSLKTLLILIVPSLTIQLTFNDWAGGFSPAGRYILPFFVLLTPAIAYGYLGLKKSAKSYVFWLFVSGQILLSALHISMHPAWDYAGQPNPIFSTATGNWLTLEPIFNVFLSPIEISLSKFLLLSLQLLATATIIFSGYLLAKRINKVD